MNLLVTGASGMIGSAVMRRSAVVGWPTRAVLRKASAGIKNPCVVGDINDTTDWSEALQGMDGVIHVAGLAHARNARPDEVRRVNVLGAARLAESCVGSSVRRFVFLSTAKVYGDCSHGRPFHDEDPVQPADLYSLSKLEGERAVRAALLGSSVNLTVVRSPLVYGPGVKANFLSLLRLVDSGIPLPLGAIQNERSMIFVDNLADLLIRCASSHSAEGETFLASEGLPCSTPQLVRDIADSLGKPARLFDMPPKALLIAARLIGKIAAAERLIESFAVDGARAQNLLRWSPPFEAREGLARVVFWFKSDQSKRHDEASVSLQN